MLRTFFQGCTNPWRQVYITTKFFTLLPSICGSSVWNLVCVNFGSYNFKVAPIFFKNSAPLLLFTVSHIPSSLFQHFAEMNAVKMTYFNNQLNAQFLYSITICMLHYNPRHFSSINMLIFRRTNYIITTSVIITLCKRLYSMPDESDDTRCCDNTVCPPEDGYVNA